MDITSLSGENAKILDEKYRAYLENPASVEREWIDFFKVVDNGGLGEAERKIARARAAAQASSRSTGSGDDSLTAFGIRNVLNAYRNFGHLAARLDPLGLSEGDRSVINEKLHNLTEGELDTIFDSGVENLGQAKLRDIISWFETTYCSTIGAEHNYLVNEEERLWLQNEMESTANSGLLTTWERIRAFDKVVHADYFEQFLAKKYVGKKRFSLEGGEALIPLLDHVIENAGEHKMDGIVIGMAHRGRLNVLCNIIEKPASQIFAEFEENYNPDTLDYADVKYHLGYSNKRMTNAGHEIHLSLMFNPSHLEAVNPVVLGSVRARQTLHEDTERQRYMGIVIHGDAAFAGQGVNAETLNLMNVEGFDTGGTIHIVVNNQIGFTTLPFESRSTLYATDLAKGFQVPIWHVNGDDPEAAVRVVKMAMAYRRRFNKDVIIDLICYRRHGHNEMDEPAFTQPTMYDKIKKHPRLSQVFEQQLLQYDDISQEDLDFVKNGARAGLEGSFRKAHEENVQMQVDTMKGEWAEYSLDPLNSEPETALLVKQMADLGRALTEPPEGVNAHPKLVRLLEQRRKMFQGELAIDWGFAEALAFGSILKNGNPIRLCGQDAQRGTFSHRHAVLVDVQTGEKWIPLNNVNGTQAHFEVINSPLSEFAVLGYEYGFSLSHPDCMTMWEAQFGDFANGAQIIFDQFLTSSEVKWYRLSGLVVLLPHGYEGQGPEHSSARLERFLQLCARENIQVCNCTTAAQYFHLLRRQALRKYRKPLIVMTPKSLLRLPAATSDMADLTRGVFREVIWDKANLNPSEVKRVILCSGKVYFDLEQERQKRGIKEIAIVRVEQLYPYPKEELDRVIEKYPALYDLFWVQEEPLNMGAWLFVEGRLREQLPKGVTLGCVARATSASPAAGFAKVHQVEQQDIVERALGR